DTDKLQALIIDSWFDNYLGVVSLVRVMQGEDKRGDKLLVMSTGRTHQLDDVCVFTPKRKSTGKLSAGEVGWITASIKDVHGAPVGARLQVMTTDRTHRVDGVGVFTPKRKSTGKLSAGEVGWITASIKDVHGASVGNTQTLAGDPAPEPLPGIQEKQPRVFAGLFPVNAAAYPGLPAALDTPRAT